MTRRLKGGKLVIASHNPGKVEEIAALLAPFGTEVVAASELGLEAPEETGESFRENAELKARAAAGAARLPALADDSGLVAPALGGAPGIHSARWAGEGRDFRAAMERVEQELGDADRSAWFACVLALCWPDGECATFEGRVTVMTPSAAIINGTTVIACGRRWMSSGAPGSAGQGRRIAAKTGNGGRPRLRRPVRPSGPKTLLADSIKTPVSWKF